MRRWIRNIPAERPGEDSSLKWWGTRSGACSVDEWEPGKWRDSVWGKHKKGPGEEDSKVT